MTHHVIEFKIVITNKLELSLYLKEDEKFCY